MASEQATPTTAVGTGWNVPSNIEVSGTQFASYSIPAAPPSGGGTGGSGGGGTGGSGGGGGRRSVE